MRRPHPFRAAVLLVALLAPAVAAQRPSPSGTLAITGVTVIDVGGGRRLPRQTVLVRGTRITAVGPVGRTSVPAGARRVDGRGRFLLPGLWDVHVHAGPASATTLPLLLAYGVTAARDLHFGDAEEPTRSAVALRDSLNAGLVTGPRYIVGTQIAGPGAGAPSAYHAATPEEGRAAVRRIHAEHADLVKAYSALSRETYAAVMDEARSLGMPVDGHVPNLVGVMAASDAGQRTIEHVAESGVLFGCTRTGPAWGEEVRRARATGNLARGQVVWAILRRAAEAYDDSTCHALARRLSRNGTAFTPTLHVQRAVYTMADVDIPAGERALLPASLRLWYDSARTRPNPDLEAWRAYLRRERDIVHVMQEEGVTLLSGTDLAPWGFPVPGASLHEELGLLVEAGLTPLQALRAATINPARTFRMTDSLGTIAKGKLADLVLVDADPLVDIANARRIVGVHSRGRWFDRAALDSMQATVKRRFADPR